MKKDPSETLIGNDIYEGYCKDLADMIAKKLGISCKFIVIYKINVLYIAALLLLFGILFNVYHFYNSTAYKITTEKKE